MQITQLSADNLRKELRARQLETTGTQSVLLNRLRKHVQESASKRKQSNAIQPTSIPVSVAILGSAAKGNSAKPIGAASFVKAATISAELTAAHRITPVTTAVRAMPLSAQHVAPIPNVNNGGTTISHENDLPGGIIASSSTGTDPSAPASASKDGVRSALDLSGTPTQMSATTPPGKAIAKIDGEETLQDAIARRRERFGLPPLPKPAAGPPTKAAGDEDGMAKLARVLHARLGKPSTSRVDSPAKAIAADPDTAELIRRRHERFGTGPNPADDRAVKTTAEEEAEVVRRRHERFGTGPKEPKPATVERTSQDAKIAHERKQTGKVTNMAAPTADNVPSNVGQDATGAGQKKRKRDGDDDNVCGSPASKRRVDGRVKNEVRPNNDRCKSGQKDRRTSGRNERHEERRKFGYVGVGGCRDGRIAKAGRRHVGCMERSTRPAKPVTQGLRENERKPPTASQGAVQNDARRVEEVGVAVEGDVGRKWCERIRSKANTVKRDEDGGVRDGRCLDGRITKAGRRGTGSGERSGRPALKSKKPVAQGLRSQVKEPMPAVSRGAAQDNGGKVKEGGTPMQGNMGRKQWKRGGKSNAMKRSEDSCVRARGCHGGRIKKAGRPSNSRVEKGANKK